jgi:hypothetical protein
MKKDDVCLRLQPSLLEEARKVAVSEGVALDQLINVAVAEKLSALRTEDYFRDRAQRSDPAAVGAVLERAGRGKPPIAGDKIREKSPKRAK